MVLILLDFIPISLSGEIVDPRFCAIAKSGYTLWTL